MTWLSWWRRPTSPGTMTADRNCVIITIRKDALRDPAIVPLLEGVGDFGGLDFGEIEFTRETCEAIIRAARPSFIRGQR